MKTTLLEDSDDDLNSDLGGSLKKVKIENNPNDVLYALNFNPSTNKNTMVEADDWDLH